jgi:U6 snRNA-associated Sm-like protein LSm2
MTVVDKEKFPMFAAVNNCFVRGSVIRYVQLPAEDVDVELLRDASRRAAVAEK